MLWALGPARLDDVAQRAAAVVGTRAATAYGEHVAADLAAGLAERDVAVVSGGAYGIDGAAHRAALAVDGITVAVLAGGIDIPYPAGHSALLHRIATDGLLVTEYPPGVRPARHRFLTRNRLVAALAGAAVVVEAGLRSGAANTAAWARVLGRIVGAVPGPVTSSASSGCHALLRDGAEVVTRAEDVVELVGRIGELAPEPTHPVSPLDELSDDERQVYEALPGRGSATVDEIAIVAAVDPARILASLAMLELAGLAEREDGCWRIVRNRRQPARPGPPRIVEGQCRRRGTRWQDDQCTRFEVVRTEQVMSHMVRVVLGGNGFDTFTPSEFTDSYVKLVFVADDVDVAALPHPLTLDSFADLPATRQPMVRTITVRRADPIAREITVDIVVHGEHGVAGPWAATAQPGQPMYLMGPSGAYAPDPAADWHLLAGDETALPAISAALEALPANAIGKAFIEVAGPEDEVPLTAPEGVEVNWILRGGRADLVGQDRAGDHAPLIEAVKTAFWLPGQVHVFIHGEAQAVMHNLRPYIRKERGVDAKWASISGYWRRGRTEETFRQWKKELAAAEAGAE